MFYAVKRGRIPGVYKTWEECQSQVKRFPDCAYKKFAVEKEAWNFVKDEKANFEVETRNGMVLNTNEPVRDLSVKNKRLRSATEIDCEPLASSSSRRNCYYAVYRGLKPGVYETWTECEAQIKNHKNASYRKFESEKEAEEFAKSGGIKKVTKSEAKRLKVDTNFEEIDSVTPSKIKLNLNDTYNVFTDGASSKNGSVLAAAGIGVYWGPNHPLNASQRLAGRQTNNRAEIYAATYALKQAKQFGARKIKLYSDSQFMIKGITQWIDKWKKNGWLLSNREPVKNKEDFIELDKARQGLEVEFIYIKAHANLPGNTEADRLAVEGAQKDKMDAFVILT